MRTLIDFFFGVATGLLIALDIFLWWEQIVRLGRWLMRPFNFWEKKR